MKYQAKIYHYHEYDQYSHIESKLLNKKGHKYLYHIHNLLHNTWMPVGLRDKIWKDLKAKKKNNLK